MRKNLFAGFTVFICLSLNIFAQQADAVSTILDTPLMTRAQAAYIAATWLDMNLYLLNRLIPCSYKQVSGKIQRNHSRR